TTRASFEKICPLNKQTPRSKPNAAKCKNCQAVSRPRRKRASPLQLARRWRVKELRSWLSSLWKRGFSIIPWQLQSPKKRQAINYPENQISGSRVIAQADFLQSR